MSRANDIAILGTACRLPGGVQSPDDLWRLLIEGRDAVTEIPDDRWDKRHFRHPSPDEAGLGYTFRAGTLGDVSGFDASFFGISPREAEQIDPQQRLLLEMSWEALERAGQSQEALAGSRCAVYVGISGTDYADVRQGDPASANAYFMLGSTLSIAANRLSYVFDLHGPSMAIDTACSSALVALHEAVHALREGRASMAVVAAINLLLSPFPFIGFSKASMLSPYGQCRAFDRIAKGYVRAEGGGAVILKPLAAAERDGDPILAVIRGVGVNSDGRTQGIALPSTEWQEALLRQVYQESGVDPRNLVYFEAHGTGTEVGDPIETGAIGRALAQHRPSGSPLIIGSIKSNIGHLEPASGMAGLIKAVEVLRHRTIVPSLHCAQPNPQIDFAGLNLAVATAPQPLAETSEPAAIGVNSFGFGGTNAHVIIEEYRAAAKSAAKELSRPPLVLSARCPKALAAAAGRIADVLDGADAPHYYDVAYTSALRRTHHQHRLIVHSAHNQALLGDLRAVAAGETAADATLGRTVSPSPRLAFIFSGNGAQWLGMGLELLEQDAAFRAEIDAIDALVRELAGWSVVEELRAAAEVSRIADTRFSQPLLFAVQAGLTRALAARGLAPAAVTGHSVGEVAAAYAAGVLDRRQAVWVILCRSTSQGKTRGLGRMAAVALDAEAAREAIAPFDGAIEVAAINSPSAVTLSGSEAALLELKVTLSAQGTDFRLLDLDYAFHNRVLDPYRDELLASLGEVRSNATAVRYYSTVTGAILDGTELDAGYWWDNVRQPVRFREAVEKMLSDGFDVLVEIGPHPILQSYIRQILRGAGSHGQLLGTVNRQNATANRLDRAVDQAYVLGAPVDWQCFFPITGTCVELPSYPWQRESFWFPRTPEARGPLFTRWDAPLLGWRPVPAAPLWEVMLDPRALPFLADHQVGGAVVFPAAGFVEIALEASRQMFGDDRHDVEQLEIRRPLTLDRTKMVRFTWNAEQATFQIASRTRMQDEPWSVHCTGRLTKAVQAAPAQPPAFAAGPTGRRIEAADHYAFAESIGLVYGPAFRTVTAVTVDGDVAEAELTPMQVEEGFEMHPALFDGCLQALFNLLRNRVVADSRPHAFLPSQIGRLLVHGNANAATRCRITLKRLSLRSLVADFTLLSEGGDVLVEARACRFQRMELGVGPRLPGQYVIEATPLVSKVLSAPALRPALAAEEAEPTGYLDAVAAAFARDAMATAGAPASGEIGQAIGAIATAAPDAPAETLWRQCLGAHPERLPELVMLGRIGLHLADMLSGEAEAVALPTAATAEHFLDASRTVLPCHEAVIEAVRQVVRTWPAHRRLRVIELGGESTSLTRRLLDVLPGDGLDYTVAVLDADAVPMVEANLVSGAGRTVLALDPAVPVESQAALQPGSYDLVIAVNALGAWTEADAGFRALGALGRDGAAIITAAPQPSRWLDLIGLAYAAARRPFPARPVADLSSAASAAGLSQVRSAAVAEGQICCAVRQAPTAAAAPGDREDRPWLILASPHGREGALAADLARRLEQQHLTPLLLHPDDVPCDAEAITVSATSPQAWHDLLATFKEADSAPAGVIHLFGVEDRDGDASPWDRRCLSALALVQGTGEVEWAQAPRLVLVTAGAMPLDGEADGIVPAQAPLWGLGRVLRNENPGLGLRLIDLHGNWSAELSDALAAEIARPDDEDEVLLAADRRLGLRVRRLAAPARAEGEAETLSFAAGSLDHLAWVPTERRAVADEEIEIAVQATGLNFRDVMLALGALPDEAVENGFAGATVGMEAAGVVTRVGSGIDRFRPGDEVLFFAPACFSSHVCTRTTAVAKKPAALGFAEAATIPTTFFTIYYALQELARLQPGERVLIHGAAGGVGLAAIQYARHVGAEIFATAGTPEKRDIVRLAGVAADHIFDSRSLGFAEAIRAMTGGEGVDVVLNSLAGEAIHKSLQTLRPFGRFLELGKRDFYANSPLGLRPFRNNISYFGIDADQLMAVRPELAARLFAEVMDLFACGVFTPLPYRTFTRDRVVEAFRHMQQSRHVGKIIVAGRRENRAVPAAVATQPGSLRLDPAAAYLVTGGLAGFGLVTARWLADKGARHLILASRRGVAEDEAKDVIAALEAQGVHVTAAACDVTDPAQVQALIDRVAAERPLKGVVHAAAVFDDGIAAKMTAEQFSRVAAPKIVGAWALHEATLGCPLDFFVAYSSVTTALGNPGQANYVAGNMYLEALAHHRRSLGLPALAVGWGAIADAGYLTRNVEVRDSLSQRKGITALTTEAALSRLEPLLLGDAPATVVVADLDWKVLGAMLGASRPPRFSEIAPSSHGDGGGEAIDLTKLLSDLSPEEVREVLIDLVAEQVGTVLRIPPDRLDLTTSIFDMGMDSLMALELRMAIEEKFGVDLPPMALTEGASITRLAERIRDHLMGAAQPKSDGVRELLAAHGEAELGAAVADLAPQKQEPALDEA